MSSLRVARLCAWLAVAGVVVAAAEPSIKTAPTERVGILQLVVDRSGSTAADDLAPTRLDAIRQATLALLDRVPEGVRVGLVAFSDKPVTLARPTTDRDAVRARLASLSSYGGTAVGDALRRAWPRPATSRSSGSPSARRAGSSSVASSTSSGGSPSRPTRPCCTPSPARPAGAPWRHAQRQRCTPPSRTSAGTWACPASRVR